MSTTSRVRIKVNTEGDFVYGQEFAAEPIIVPTPSMNNLTLDVAPVVQIDTACENYFILIPPVDNQETIYIRGAQTDTPIGLLPNVVSSIALASASIWISASGPTTIRYMLL